MSADRYWILFSRRLSGEITEEELKELAALTPPEKTENAALSLLEEHWPYRPEAAPGDHEEHMLALLRGKLKDDESYGHREIEAPAEARWRGRLAWAGGLAAAVAGIALAVSWFSSREPEAVLHEIVAKPGIKSRIALPDGSTVWLNSGSRLVYNEQFGRRNRSLQLNGEAFFDVAPQDDLPFVIDAAGVQVKVLGTSFNLKAYDTEQTVETALVTGKVQVNYAVGKQQETVLLKPMEKLRISRAPVEGGQRQQKEEVQLETLEYLRGKDSLIAETAWKENTFSADKESFTSLAARLERWYDIKIAFSGETLKNLEFTATVKGERMEEVFEALVASSGNRFRYSFNKEERTVTIQETR